MDAIKPTLSGEDIKQGKAYEKIAYKSLVDDEPSDSILIPKLAEMAGKSHMEAPAIQYEQLRIMGRFVSGPVKHSVENARVIAIVRHFE